LKNKITKNLASCKDEEKKTSIPTYKAQDQETLFQQRLDETYQMKKMLSYQKTIPTNI